MRSAILILMVLFAGCASPAPSVGDEPTPTTPVQGGPTVAIEACGREFCEPSIAGDSEGRLFVTTFLGDFMAVSEDGGATFEARSPPPFPANAPTEPRYNDAIVQVDPAGRLFFSALLIGSGDPGGVFVARSDDGARSWSTGAFLAVSRAAPTSGSAAVSVVADRQWLGFGADGAVYASYTQAPSGSHVSRSDDDGVTFGAFLPAATVAERGNFGQASPIVGTSDGRMLMAHLTRASPFALAEEGLATVRVSFSDDRGVTWQFVEAHAAPPNQSAGYQFPILAVGPDDTLHLTWVSEPGVLHHLVSSDRGDTWSQPTVVSRPKELVPTAAWIVADGSLRALYYSHADDLVSVILATGATSFDEWIVVASGIVAGERTIQGFPDPRGAARTDFAHFAVLPDARTAVVWADDIGQVFVRTL